MLTEKYFPGDWVEYTGAGHPFGDWARGAIGIVESHITEENVQVDWWYIPDGVAKMWSGVHPTNIRLLVRSEAE